MDRIDYLYNEIIKDRELYTDIKNLIEFHIQTYTIFIKIENELINMFYTIVNEKTKGNLSLLKSESEILFKIFVYEYWN